MEWEWEGEKEEGKEKAVAEKVEEMEGARVKVEELMVEEVGGTDRSTSD